MNEWIKCDERMPEIGKAVLVLFGNKSYSVCVYTGPEKGNQYPDNFIWEERDDCHKREDITHWMLLPEPPK